VSSANRILIVDDNRAIHEDFAKVLGAQSQDSTLDSLESELFGATDTAPETTFTVDSAFQGEDAVAMVHRAVKEGAPYSLIFMDVRMPPGMDGIETTRRVWESDPNVQVVICTAYSDYDWESMSATLGAADRWLILKKPFDVVEVRQMAYSQTRKWTLAREAEEHIDTLERRVRERTAALQRTQKLDALARLIAGIGHELSTPLLVAGGNLEFALEEIEGVQADSGLDMSTVCSDLVNSRDAIRRVAGVVKDLHIFGQHVTAQTGPVDIVELVNATTRLVHSQLSRRGRLDTHIEPDLPRVIGTRGTLEQALMAVMMNAAQALPDNSPADSRVEVRVEDGGEFVVLTVKDNGCGILREHVARVFDPFFTTRPVGEGKGLGLTICHEIVTSVGGKIDIESSAGTGTTVTMWLPVTVTRAERRRSQLRAQPHSATRRVLIVEDESYIVCQIERALPDYEVVVAPTIEEAVLRAQTADFDAVLSDVDLHGVGEQSLYHRLAAARAGLEDRLILMTGLTTTAAGQAHLDSVATPRVHKPFSREELRAVMPACSQQAA